MSFLPAIPFLSISFLRSLPLSTSLFPCHRPQSMSLPVKPHPPRSAPPSPSRHHSSPVMPPRLARPQPRPSRQQVRNQPPAQPRPRSGVPLTCHSRPDPGVLSRSGPTASPSPGPTMQHQNSASIPPLMVQPQPQVRTSPQVPVPYPYLHPAPAPAWPARPDQQVAAQQAGVSPGPCLSPPAD